MQDPQWSGFVWRLKHAPAAAHHVWPAGQQCAPEQSSPVVHAVHDPQCDGSFCGLTQEPPQQICPAPQLRPHDPQLSKLVLVSTHVPSHDVWPVGQHSELVHDSLDRQLMPQVPQLSWFVVRSTHAPLQHTWPASHVVPHAPQWKMSLSRSTHPLSQQSGVAPPQAMPHDPQFASSMAVSTHPPPQHVSAGSAQALPHDPQFAGSPSRSAQLGAQHVWSAVQSIRQSVHCVLPGSAQMPSQQVSVPVHPALHAPQFAISLR